MKAINKDFKFNDGKEHCRVFCKGFKKDISREEIVKIFEPVGTIVDIRLPETREVNYKKMLILRVESSAPNKSTVVESESERS